MRLEVSLTDFVEAGEPIEYSTQTCYRPVAAGLLLPENFLNAFAHIGRALHDLDARRESGHLLGRCTLQRAMMAPASQGSTRASEHLARQLPTNCSLQRWHRRV